MIVIEHEDGRVFVDCKDVVSTRSAISFTVHSDNIFNAPADCPLPDVETRISLNFMVVKDIRSERVKTSHSELQQASAVVVNAAVSAYPKDTVGGREWVGYSLALMWLAIVVSIATIVYTLLSS